MIFGGSVTGNTAGSGDTTDGSTLAAADVFVLADLSLAKLAVETFAGSGSFVWQNAATITDFDLGLDRIAIDRSYAGDGDEVIVGVSDAGLDGSFSASDELIFFRSPPGIDIVTDPASGFQPIPYASGGVGSVIGTASAAIPVFQTRLFVVTDGESSAILVFQSNDGNALVTLDELYLLGVVAGQPLLSVSDLALI